MKQIKQLIYNHTQNKNRDLYIQLLFSRNFWEMIETNYKRDNTSNFILDIIYKLENNKPLTNQEIDEVSLIYQNLETYIYSKPHRSLDTYITNLQNQLSKYQTYNVVFDYTDLDGILSYLTLKNKYQDKVKIQGIIQRTNNQIFLHTTKDFKYLYDTKQLIVLDFELPYQFNISNHNILIPQNINSNARLHLVTNKYPGNTVYLLKRALNDQEIDILHLSCDGMLKNQQTYPKNFQNWFDNSIPKWDNLNPNEYIFKYKQQITLPELPITYEIKRTKIWNETNANIINEKTNTIYYNIMDFKELKNEENN